MRFFHHKHQCYIVGEGSFVGKCGNISDLVDVHGGDTGVTASMLESSPMRGSSLSIMSPHEIEVTVDVETIDSEAEVATSLSPAKPSLGPQSGQISSFHDDSTLPKIPAGDEVVYEDGEL